MKEQSHRRKLSLRARLAVLLTALMVVAIAFSSLLLTHQHHISVEAADGMVAAHERMARTSEMRRLLTNIDRGAAADDVGARNTADVALFHRLVADAKAGDADAGIGDAISRLDDAFVLYVQALGSRDPGAPATSARDIAIRERFDAVVAALGALSDQYEKTVFRTTQQLRAERDRSFGAALILLVIFVLLTAGGGMKAMAMITAPISLLIRRIDEVNPESELPESVPLQSPLPEVAQVAGSFDRLVQRLRGYRALNIHRLLIEKRRADILAATITDGIILLRNDEIVYANPTGEQILGLAPGSVTRGLRLSALIAAAETARAAAKGTAAGETPPPTVIGVSPGPVAIESSGPRAVAEAVSRTIPTELALAVDDRRAHYLIHSSRISFDLGDGLETSIRAASDLAETNDTVEISRMLQRFQANTLVVAQDVTIVKESQEAKSHFLATLSHEIKTPVTSLTMATRLLRKSLDQIPNATHRSLVQTCADDVDRLRRLLDDLLTSSRFDTLTQRLELQNIDLAKLVRHSVQSFQAQAAERAIELSSKVLGASGQIYVPMDPAKVAWALSNLLTNALRHTPRGGRVHAWIEAGDEWIKVGIQDSGPGIDRKRQDRIFDKFNPYYDLRVARTGSTGMGLAIAKEIVVAHGGRIWVSSEPGCGAEFCFTLPIRKRSGLKTTGIMTNETPQEGKGAMNGTPARG